MTPPNDKKSACVFLPHVGLGKGGLQTTMLPTLLYTDPLPLLMFDKLLIDRSLYHAFDTGDEFELKLLEELTTRGIVEIRPFTEETTVEKRCFKLFADFSQEAHGITLLPKKTAIRDIDEEAFQRALAKEHLHGPFSFFQECYLALQITRDIQIPMIRSDPNHLILSDYILSTDKRRKLHKAMSPEGLAYDALRETFDLYGPSVPLLTTSDGRPIPPMPIFLRHIGMRVEGQEEEVLDESKSWENVEKLIELRDSSLLGDFRTYIQEISACVVPLTEHEGLSDAITKEHSKRLLELQREIAMEYQWLHQFAKVSGYLSIPLALAGFAMPPLGIASAGMAIGSVAAEVTRQSLMKTRESDPKFYETHSEFRWRLFFANLESKYKRNDFLSMMKRLLS